jgi:transposase-like protein
LGREPDAGDLLLVLASLPESLVARVVSELGIDDAALRAALERARAAGPPSPDEELERIRAQQEQASEPEQRAALRSEEERILGQRDSEALARARARLELPNPD